MLETALRMVGNEIRHRARVVREFGPCPRVLATELRLLQVFVNLLLNAAQSMDDGRVGANQIRVGLGTDASGQAVVDITDTGRGIEAQHRDRVFEAYFTTRPARGTGLGLSISRSIVQDLGGEITVLSEPGKGSTFRVSLPGSSLAARPQRRH